MNIDCSQVNKLKEVYVDGMLEPEVKAAIDGHAGACKGCRQRLDLARRLEQGLGGALKAGLGNPSLSGAQASAMRDRLTVQGTGSLLHNVGLARLEAWYQGSSL